MFPCQFGIPGHSGTDQKHRKAFSKVRKHHKQRAHSWVNTNREAPAGPADRSRAWSPFIKRIVGYSSGVLLLILLCLVGWLGNSIFGTYVASSPHKKPEDAVDIDAYRMLTRSGEAYLYRYIDWNSGVCCDPRDLKIARSEFVLALRSCEACPEASRGLQHVQLLEKIR